MGKSSWHYIYEYIIFIAHFLNNDFIHVFVQDFYRCEKGMMPKAMQVASKACYKLVADMLYEVRIQAVIDYKAKIEKVRIYKGHARDIRSTCG